MADKSKDADKSRSLPGTRWRFLAHGAQDSSQLENCGVFDELVVDDWLHIEQMDERMWWLRVGDARIIVTISADGAAVVNVERGSYGPICGQTITAGQDGSDEAK